MPADTEDLLERLDNIDIHLDTLLAHADTQADERQVLQSTIERMLDRLSALANHFKETDR